MLFVNTFWRLQYSLVALVQLPYVDSYVAPCHFRREWAPSGELTLGSFDYFLCSCYAWHVEAVLYIVFVKAVEIGAEEAVLRGCRDEFWRYR